MSDLKTRFVRFLIHHPEITKAKRLDIVNRRALARLLIERGIAEKDEFSALLGVLRRFDYDDISQDDGCFEGMTYSTQSGMSIFTYQKTEEVLAVIEDTAQRTQLTKGHGVKAITATNTITVIARSQRSDLTERLASLEPLLSEKHGLVEASLQFSEEASTTPGILGAVTQAMHIHDVTIHESMTSRDELLLFIPSHEVTTVASILESWTTP